MSPVPMESTVNPAATPAFEVTVPIRSSPARVWDVLVHASDDWASAFSPGTVAQTDWLEGSRIVWRDGSGAIGATGIVEAVRPQEHIRLRYYDEAVEHPKGPLGDYAEEFRLAVSGDRTVLTACAGTIAGMDEAMHRAMWEQALAKIKALAEDGEGG
ncbi:MAG: SRPBCC domain-containing protein [Burkholderiaceae bacterium]